MTRSQQIKTFLEKNSYGDAELVPLAGDASFRHYIRLHRGGKSWMLMDAPPEKEDVRPYLAIARHLTQRSYSAPKILAEDAGLGLLLLEDLGSASFTSVLKTDAGRERELYEAAIDLLAAWHHGKDEVANPKALPLPAYDEALLLREVSLFSDWFLPQLLGKEKVGSLRGEYMALWQALLKDAPLQTQQFVHRDYHADNLMWLPSRQGTARVGLLDFQDGVYGDAAYDMVSLLEDARRDVPPALASTMIEHYLKASGAEPERFKTAYAVLGAQRNSKIVGIFTRLAARDNKTAYLNYLPRVWKHLENDLAHPALKDLRVWLSRYVGKEDRGIIAIRHNAQELA